MIECSFKVGELYDVPIIWHFIKELYATYFPTESEVLTAAVWNIFSFYFILKRWTSNVYNCFMKFVAFRIEYAIFTKGVFNYIIIFSFLLRSSNNEHYQNKESSNSDIVIGHIPF